VCHHGDQDRWHERQVGDPALVDGTKHLGELELGEDDDGGAASEQPRGEGDEAVDVEHGHGAEEGLHGVRQLEAESVHDDLDHGDEVPVRGDDALAGPRCARGVEQRGLVVLRDVDPPARVVRPRRGDLFDGGDDAGVGGDAGGLEEDDTEAGVARELGEEIAGGEGEHGARVGDLLGDLGGGVGGGEDGAEGHGRQGGDREVDGVGGEDERDLALAEGEGGRGECGAHPRHRAPELRERDFAAGGCVDERDDARVAAGGEEGDDVEILRGVERDGSALAVEGARRGKVAAARVHLRLRRRGHRDRLRSLLSVAGLPSARACVLCRVRLRQQGRADCV
jgi:hypothetical protein